MNAGRAKVRLLPWLAAWGIVVLSLTPGVARPQYKATRFQASSVRPEVFGGQIFNGAVEMEPDIAGEGDSLVAVWSQYPYPQSRHVGWASSTDGGASWSFGGNIVGTERQDGMPSLAVGGGAYYATCVLETPVHDIGVARGAFGESGFQWGPVITAVRLDAFTAPRTYFPDVACDSTGSAVFVSYTEVDRCCPIPTWSRVGFARSTDRGETWSPPQTLSSDFASAARLAMGPDGEVYAIWVDHVQDAVVGRKSVDLGQTFGPEFVVAPYVHNQGARPPGWDYPLDQEHPTLFDRDVIDCPSIAVDRGPGASRGRVYVTWTERATGDLDPETEYTFEVEPNNTFAEANLIQIGNRWGGTLASADFGTDGQDVFAFDGTAGTTVELFGYVSYSTREPNVLAYGMYCLGDSGRIHLVDGGFLGYGYPTAPFVLTLPVTTRYYITVLNGGPDFFDYQLWLYRLGAIAPGSAAQDHRDVVLVSSGDGGATWSAKVRVNDDPPGFDNALPAVGVDRQGRVHVSWYDRRTATDCLASRVATRWAWSNDAGQTFAPSAALGQPSDFLAFHGIPGCCFFGDVQEGPWYVGNYQSITPVGDKLYAVWSEVLGARDVDVFGARIEPDGITATLVSGFSGERRASAAMLRWHVDSPAAITGFRVHRAPVPNGTEATVVEVPVTGGGWHEWWDRDLDAGRAYRYRLEVVTATAATWEGPIELAVPAMPASLAFTRTRPNPTSGLVELELVVPERGHGRVQVLSVQGRELARVREGTFEAGPHPLAWDGRDRSGRLAPAGVYVVRARVGRLETTARVCVVR